MAHLNFDQRLQSANAIAKVEGNFPLLIGQESFQADCRLKPLIGCYFDTIRLILRLEESTSSPRDVSARDCVIT